MSYKIEKEIQPTKSEELLNTISESLKSPSTRNDRSSGQVPSTPGSSFEVFRNNTTAVEVIVKEVTNKCRKNNTTVEFKDRKMRRLEEEIENLKIDLNRANFKIITIRKGFSTLVQELKKQMDLVNQREMDAQSRSLCIQLENEKLKTLLESKSKLLAKLRKEIVSMKRMLKFVIKGICCAPQLPDNMTFSSDPEYDDFEKGLKRECHVRFASNLFEGPLGGTFDSTLSKDYNSFDK